MLRDTHSMALFDKLLVDITRAKFAWFNGEHDEAERILKKVGAIALGATANNGDTEERS